MNLATDINTTSVIDIRKNRLRSDLLKELYKNSSTSINKLARLFHTSIPSTTGIVNELIREGWVIEKGIGAARAGRPPVLYGLNPVKQLTLVLDINRNDTHFLLFDLSNKLLHRHEVGMPLVNEPAFLEKLMDRAEGFLSDLQVSSTLLWGVGISMPGLISAQNGINQTYLNLTPAGIPLAAHIRKRLGVPVCLINDTRATTLGEYRFGLAKKHKNVLTINIDWGVGLGILLNGEVFSGSSGFAGELGHIQVRPDGILCDCGKVGCLDTITSALALIRQAQEGIENGKATLLTKLIDNKVENLTTHHIIEAVRNGDEFSIDLLSVLGKELGKGLATAVHLFNPEIIIVTGILAQAGAFISNPIEQSINRYCLADFKNSLKISISEIGSKARLLGTQAHLFDYLAVEEFRD